MPEPSRAIVTNTTPLIALSIATGSLEILRSLYERVIVPFEVAQEIRVGGQRDWGVEAFSSATWIEQRLSRIEIPSYLRNTLDQGEASVIQTALDENIDLVCIDEAVGRRIARLSGLNLTGSLGILLKANAQGYPVSIPDALDRMRQHGIWLSDAVVRFVLEAASKH